MSKKLVFFFFFLTLSKSQINTNRSGLTGIWGYNTCPPFWPVGKREVLAPEQEQCRGEACEQDHCDSLFHLDKLGVSMAGVQNLRKNMTVSLTYDTSERYSCIFCICQKTKWIHFYLFYLKFCVITFEICDIEKGRKWSIMLCSMISIS